MLLEAFYEQQKEKLTAVLARYSGDTEAARDAVQVSFLKALQNREILSSLNDKALWAWLHTTAKNALVDEKRKAARYEPGDRDFEDRPAGDLTDVIVVKELMHKLPSHLFQIVSLRYWGGLNATEIGKMKGLPPATVRSQLRAALALLKKQMVTEQ